MGFLWMRRYFIEISLRKKHGIILICLILPCRLTCTEGDTIVIPVMNTVTSQRMLRVLVGVSERAARRRQQAGFRRRLAAPYWSD